MLILQLLQLLIMTGYTLLQTVLLVIVEYSEFFHILFKLILVALNRDA